MMDSVVNYFKVGLYSTQSLYKYKKMEMKKYRSNSFIKLLGFPIRFFITFMLWSIVLSSNTGNLNYYIWYYSTVFLILLMYPYVRMANSVVGLDIFNGETVKYTTKGIPYWSVRLADFWSVFTMYVPIVFGIFVTVYCIVNETFNIISILGFFYLILISSLMQLVLWTIIGMGAFWLEQTNGVSRLFMLVQDLFTGALIPLFLLPSALNMFVSYLPFQYFIYVPVQVLMNEKTSSEILIACASSSGWLLGFLILAYFLWNQGMKKHMSPL